MSNVTTLEYGIPCKPLAPVSPASAAFRSAKPATPQAKGVAAPQLRFVQAGAALYAQDEPSDEIFTVVEGWVFLHHILEDGRRQILDFLLPGDFCGFAPDQAHVANHTAEALTDVTVAVVPRSQFAAMLKADAQYAASIVARMYEALETAHDTVIDTGRRSAIEAVSNLLLRLDARIRGRENLPEGTEVSLPLTQEHLGDALGLTAVHVCRTLRVLKKRGAVSLCRHKLRIPDTDALRAIAGLEPVLAETLSARRIVGRAA